MSVLKECPFCGSPARVKAEHPKLRTGRRDTLFRVECTLRECGVTTMPWYPKRGAVQSWNRRVCYKSNVRGRCGLMGRGT